jgi:catechol 2,3-dioxygenase-like lactoylglutathione lyase family enzyme
MTFYCDVLGLKVSLGAGTARQTEHPVRWDTREPFVRESAYLRWSDDDEEFFVLSQNEHPASNPPHDISSLGVHHFSFSVDDLRERFARIKESGATIVKEPYEASGEAFGLAPERRFLTCLFRDPDGTVLQLDQPIA